MTSSRTPEALKLAREVRAGEAQHGPSKLHSAAAGDIELYRHAMVEAGYVAQGLAKGEPFRANDPCPYCGYEFGNTTTAMSRLDGPRAVPDEEARRITSQYITALGGVPKEQLEAMTAARDLCKQQTADVTDRLLALRTWLRDNHPEAYAAIPGGVG